MNEFEKQDKILVSMKATFTTNGNWNDKRCRSVSNLMDVDKIINSNSLQEAIDYFQSKVSYVNMVEDFKNFTIDGKTYDAKFWEQ